MIGQILRMLPPFKGKQRLARLLMRQQLKDGRQVFVPGKFDCRYYLPNVKETIGFEILINGIYEAGTIAFINRQLPKNSWLLDIGANIGAISIPLKKQRKNVRIICLEAAPWIFEFLERNIVENNVTDIVTINKAIATYPDQVVDFFSPLEKFGKGSLAPVFTNTPVKVTTTTLDVLAENINAGDIGLIKIDVEGFESQAFLGGKNLLSNRSAPDILFEFVDWAEAAAGVAPGEAQTILLSYGYKIYVFEGGRPTRAIDEPLSKGSFLLFATKNP